MWIYAAQKQNRKKRRRRPRNNKIKTVARVTFIFHFSNFRRSTMTDEGMELILTVMEAKELIGPPNADTFDTFVRIYMVPDESGAVQTKVNTPFIIPNPLRVQKS